MEKTRDYHMDNIKALLIFCVVLGHTITRFSTVSDHYILYKIVYSFHMPAFVWVTGYFAKYNPKYVFLKVAPLYLFTQVAHYIYDMIHNYAFGNHPIWVKIDFFTPRYALWFLFGMMIWQLFIPLIKTNKKHERIIILSCSFLLSFLVSREPLAENVLAITRIINFFPYYILGYYSKDFLENIEYKKQFPFKISAIFIGFALIYWGMTISKTVNRKIFFGTLAYGELGYTWQLKVTTWVMAILWIYVIYNLIPRRKLPLISYIGKTTLPIYLIHIFILRILEDLIDSHIITIPYLGSSIYASILLAAILTVILSWKGFYKFFNFMNLSHMRKQ